MIGERFGKLLVTGSAKKAPIGGNIRYTCLCDCGQETIVTASHLRIGKTKSCGCLRTASALRASEAASTHGMKNTAEYSTWNSMLDRCRNPNSQHRKDYGGRGIAVCERWYKFENFYADMGARPPGMTLDRYPDVNGDYEPGNCRWATNTQQQRNKRNTIYLEHAGVTQSLCDWEDSLGIPKNVFRDRLRRGWSLDKVFDTPYQAAKSRRKLRTIQ